MNLHRLSLSAGHWWMGGLIIFLTLFLLSGLYASPAAATPDAPASAAVAPSGTAEILSAGNTLTCALTPYGAADCWGTAMDRPGPYTQLSAGAYHVCALVPSGAADCWGVNESGQAEDQVGPFTQISAGDLHTCALKPSGEVDCWGDTASGQAADQAGPYTQISAGGMHTCGLDAAGAVTCWGRNIEGQADSQTGPFSAVSAGGFHTCGLTTDGKADCWGLNDDGRAGDQPGPFLQLSAGGAHTCGLTTNGAVGCWGSNDKGQAIDQTGPYIALSLGEAHSCALTPTGAADCWGDDSSGQAAGGAGPFGRFLPPAMVDIISAGAFHSCALRPSGAADCWGGNTAGQAEDQAGPYISVRAGSNQTCALTPTGAADCWGQNNYGQAEDQIGPYIQIGAGQYHTCALTPSGEVDCWGLNDDGQATDQPGPFIQVSAGSKYTCGLTPAGAVDCWGLNSDGQADDMPGPYVAISAGDTHTCALTVTGAADCWGSDSDGQAQDQLGPYIQVSAGSLYTCALTPSGAADCWGGNSDGQATDQLGPYRQLSSGFRHTCAWTTTGAADCWGRDLDGQATDQVGPFGVYVPLGTITIKKVVEDVQPNYVWAFNYSGDLGNFTLDKAATATTFKVAPGEYAVNETPAGGFISTSDSVSCDNGQNNTAGSIQISVAAEETVICTFSSKAARSRLTIIKQVDGIAAPWAFDFGGDLGEFSLSHSAPQWALSDVFAGSYTINEVVPPGGAVSVTCDNGDSGISSLTVTIGTDDDVICTFTNSRNPARLTIVKLVTGVGADYNWIFGFTGNLGVFALNRAKPSLVMESIAAGTYSISEPSAPGYSSQPVTCEGATGYTDGGGPNNGGVIVTLSVGDDATCTFTNVAEPGTITVKKEVVGIAKPWSFDFSGDLGEFSLSDSKVSKQFSGLLAGPFAISEAVVDDVTTAVTCSSGESGGSAVAVKLDPGEAVVCTFVNSAVVVPPVVYRGYLPVVGR